MAKDNLLDNEMRSFKNRGFHDGYDEGKRAAASQEAFDSGYKKAFEQNFILSTLKGVASALKTSYNLNTNHHQPRPTSTTSTSSSSSTSTAATSTSSSPSSTSSSNQQCNHLDLLESMTFDDIDRIESIKSDLIKICRDNRLEILAHYVSQIG